MTIVTYSPLNVQVEILDEFDSREGKLVVVEALKGKPFVGGDKWAIPTCFATVKISDLAVSEDEPENLLSLALAAKRDQWPNAETVWLVGTPKAKKGAYLKNVGGWVYLYAVGYGPGIPAYFLDPAQNAWVESRQLRKNYSSWAEKAKEALKPKPPACEVCHGRRRIFTKIGEAVGRQGKYNQYHCDPCPRCGQVEAMVKVEVDESF